MGRKILPRQNYVKDSQNVYRLREAVRLDPRVSIAHKTELAKAASDLIAVLMEIDQAKENGNVRQKAS